MRIAVVGAGISGLAAAYVLQRGHEVVVFEQSSVPGGHALTLDVDCQGKRHAVDLGFVVYNPTTYPNFVRLLEQLGVESQPTEMSFGVRCDETGLEYCGTSLNTLFAQRRNLLRLSFYRLLFNIFRFNGSATRLEQRGELPGTVRDYLARSARSASFRQYYLAPLIAAIWSLDPGRVDDFPAGFLLRFMSRHRLLQAQNQLQWRVIRGGAREYVRKLSASLRGGVLTNTPVRSVRRLPDAVEIRRADGEPELFDHLVLATHSDQSLRLLDDPSPDEREILGAIEYQANRAVLHTDASMLPTNRRAWANWNYRLPKRRHDKPITTYNMSGLQGLDSAEPICITLNDSESIDPARIIRHLEYSHPVYTSAVIESQKKKNRISGVRRTHYCGAYWGSGFHEDGLTSALEVCRGFGQRL